MRFNICCLASLTFVCLHFAVGVSAIAETATKPNIVFILADDMGYGDLKAFNPDSQISTPHLDGLAETGLCFTDAHSGGSTCKPSRYSLMTGRFAARRNNFNDKSPIISNERSTTASMLQKNGYRTAMVGKWHLGFQRIRNAEGNVDYTQRLTGGPFDRGFDSFFGMHASLDIPPYYFIRDNMAVKRPVDTVEASSSVGGEEDWNHIQGAFWREGAISSDFKHEEVTPRFAEEACKVISSHDGSKPFFLYVPLPSPHTPWLPSKEFRGKSKAGMYGDFMMMVDAVVGQILGSLDAAGVADNTLVMFSSDNGPVWYQKDVDRFGHQSVGSLRGCKASVWEGGHRVPFIVRWPGHVKAGSRTDRTITFADVYATLAGVAGQTEIAKGVAEDSESFLNTLLHPEKSGQRTSPILHGKQTIRQGEWKLIDTKGSRGFNADKSKKYGVELYNLDNDQSETKNLAEEMPGRVKAMRNELRQFFGR